MNVKLFGESQNCFLAQGSLKLNSNISYLPLNNVESMSFLVSQPLRSKLFKAKKSIRELKSSSATRRRSFRGEVA